MGGTIVTFSTFSWSHPCIAGEILPVVLGGDDGS